MNKRLDISHSCELSQEKDGLYAAVLHVTAAGLQLGSSQTELLTVGHFDAQVAQGLEFCSADNRMSLLLADGGHYSLRDCRILLDTPSDGREVCDFIGLGAAVGAFNGAKIDLENCEIETRGVAKCTVFVDEGSDAVIKNSRLTVKGGKLYDGYRNSADFNYMVAPPWVLGIIGNARGTNLMGNKASTVLVGCEVKAANWGALSTDNGEENLLVVVDSRLVVEGSEDDRKNPYFKRWGSGYGTYILGADEDFCGVKIYAGTYIGIARDGNAVYRSSRGRICVKSPSSGEILYEDEGKGENTELFSDGFGIMAHGFAELTLTDKTRMETENASFLLRCGGVKIEVSDGAQLLPKDGVLVQIIDDDDMTVGVDWDAPMELQFKTEFFEKAGWPSENGLISSKMPPMPPPPMPPMPEGEEEMMPPQYDVHFTARDVDLEGNLYNGSGYYGQKAKQFYITLDAGASLRGAIAATETIHIDETGAQNCHFTIDEYYYLGHVANRLFFNGDNEVELSMRKGSRWLVSGESLLTALYIEEGAELCGRIVINGVELVPNSGERYEGEIRILPQD